MRKAIIIIFAVLITACGDQRTENMLNTVWDIVDCQPDSAIAILNEIERNRLSKKQRMKFLLLRTVAMDKLDIKLDTIQYMDDVAEYYSEENNHILQMKAYYMAGGVYRDRGNSPKALEYYRKAITAADTTQADCDFKTLSRIYGQIASLFYHKHTPELSHEAELKAVEYAERAKDTLAAIIFYEHLGATYRMMGKYDSVLYVVNNAYRKYKEVGQNRMAAGCLTQIIEIYLNKGLYAKAKQIMDEFEKNSGLFNNNGEIITEQLFYYRIKGRYYEEVNKKDSALHFYGKLLQRNNDISDIEAGYKGLMSTYGKMGIADSVVRYAKLFAITNDSSSFLASSKNIIKMQALYDYTENKLIAETKTREAERYKYVSILFFIMLLVSIYVLYINIKRYQRKKTTEMSIANKQYFNTLLQLNKAETELKLLKEDFYTYKNIKEKESSELQHAIAVICKTNDMPEVCTVGQALLNSAIIQQMHVNASKLKTASSEEWQELYRVTKENLPHFYEKINDEQTKLTDNEKNVCILTRFLFIPSETSVLLNLSKQRITNIRSSINKKLFKSEGTKNLNNNIKSL